MLSFDISTKPIEGTSLVAHTVKKLSAMQETETWVRAMGQEDPLELEMATHSSILSWRIPWTERNLAGYCPWGRKELDMTGHSTVVYTGWTQAGNSPESQRKHPMQSGYMSMYFLSYYGKVLVAQSCSTLCDPTDCRPKGSSVYEILQARILEWVATPFSRASSQPRDWTRVSCIAGISFTIWAAKEAVSKMILKDLGENPSQFKKQPQNCGVPWNRNPTTGKFQFTVALLDTAMWVQPICPTQGAAF